MLTASQILPIAALALSAGVSAAPLQAVVERNNDVKSYYDLWDLQAHRGGRGEYVESTLPAFAIGLKDGVTSLEFDCGLTKDGEVIVWHDEIIDATKCRDTSPVSEGDEMYPYVGKNVANLTLAQIKTLDCGSLRIDAFPLSEVQPGTKLSTLNEVFDFIQCATDEPVLFNIESKVNPVDRNQTRTAAEFVNAMAKIFVARGENVIERITHQSFDWEALIISKANYPTLRTSALCDSTTLYFNSSLTPAGPGDWLGGIDIDDFEGSTVAERVVRAAHSIGADYISPTMTSGESAPDAIDPSQEGWVGFVNQTMVDVAKELGMGVKPWTANRKNMLEYILDIGVDGVITDYPHEFRETLERFHPERKLAPKGDEERIRGCLRKHIQVTGTDLSSAGY